MYMKRIIFLFAISFFISIGVIFSLGATDSSNNNSTNSTSAKKDYIKYVEFNVSQTALSTAIEKDISTKSEKNHIDCITQLAYLGAKYAGDFKKYKYSDLDNLFNMLNSGKTIEDITKDMKYYNYYKKAYTAALNGIVGYSKFEEDATTNICLISEKETKNTNSSETTQNTKNAKNIEISESSKNTENTKNTKTIENSKNSEKSENTQNKQNTQNLDSTEKSTDTETRENTNNSTEYGLQWYSPIAKTFPYSHYDDFGAERTFGYTRPHLGHDMMSATGTPVIAVESGIVECLGWNMYGGWRIGIRSNDKQRYWYYAHLRQNRPYAENLKEGDYVKAGDVIGYVGRTGYSNTENINGITESHLHIGLELIFDESQKESNNEIWINLYAITSVLESNKSTVKRNNETKEFYATN